MKEITAKFRLKLAPEAILSIFAITLVSIFVLVNFFLPFNWLVYLLCLGAAGLIIFQAPEVGLYTIIFCTIIFERWFTLQSIEWSAGIIKLYPLDLIIIFTLLSFLAYWAVKRVPIIWRDKGLGWSLWLWVGVLAVYLLASLANGTADQALAFSTFKNFALYFVVYLLVINIIKTKEQFKRLINTFLAAGIGLIYFIFYGFISGQGMWSEFVPLSTTGTRFLAGPHSFYVAIMIILLGNILVWRYRRSLQDYAILALVAVFVLGIVGSLQRHLWLAIILAVAILLYFYRPKHRRQFFHLLAIGIVILMIVVMVSLWFYSWNIDNNLINSELLESAKFRFFSIFTSTSVDSSALWRLASWHQAWQVFSDNWLVGTGLGHTLAFEISEMEFDIEMRELHNDFIGVAVQLGLVGIFLVLNIFYRLVRKFLTAYKNLSSKYRVYFLTFFVLCIMFLWSANFGTYFDTNMLVVFFWIFLGGMTVSGRLGK